MVHSHQDILQQMLIILYSGIIISSIYIIIDFLLGYKEKYNLKIIPPKLYNLWHNGLLGKIIDIMIISFCIIGWSLRLYAKIKV